MKNLIKIRPGLNPINHFYLQLNFKTMKAKTLIVLVLLCTGFMACKKGDTSANPTQPSILGKWKFLNVVVNDFYSGTAHVTTYPADPSDYFDFRADGKVYFVTWGSYDTSAYKIINNNKLVIEASGDTSDIILLTSTALQLYQKQVFAPGEYSESTSYMSK